QTICEGDVPPQLKMNAFKPGNISKISIYPNPVENVLHIQNLDANGKYQLRIMNNLGNVFKQYSVEHNTSFYFNLNGLKAGVYYLKVQSGEKSSSYMFIKK
ncbi:MAG: T9SS type A sorting domain-containing protein, partial [Chitinophagaceae bacterium]